MFVFVFVVPVLFEEFIRFFRSSELERAGTFFVDTPAFPLAPVFGGTFLLPL